MVGTESSDSGGESQGELFPSPETDQRPEVGSLVPACHSLSLSQENIYPLMISENRARESEVGRCCNLCQNSTLAIQSPRGWEEERVPCGFQRTREKLKQQGEDLLHTTVSKGLGCVLGLGSSRSPFSESEFSLCWVSHLCVCVVCMSPVEKSHCACLLHFCQHLWAPFAFEADTVGLFMPGLLSPLFSHSQVSLTVVLRKWLLSTWPATCLLMNLLIRPQLSFLCPISIPTPMV